MATTYEGIPPVDELLVGAAAVVVARAVALVDRRQDDESDRMILVQRFAVDEVLAGEVEAEILVRSVVTRQERERARDEPLLLVLGIDHGIRTPGTDGPQYVPYFVQPSPIERRTVVLRPGEPVTLDELRDRLAKAARQRSEERRALTRAEEGQDLDEAYPEVMEAVSARGDWVTEARLAEPLASTPREEPGPRAQ